MTNDELPTKSDHLSDRLAVSANDAKPSESAKPSGLNFARQTLHFPARSVLAPLFVTA